MLTLRFCQWLRGDMHYFYDEKTTANGRVKASSSLLPCRSYLNGVTGKRTVWTQVWIQRRPAARELHTAGMG